VVIKVMRAGHEIHAAFVSVRSGNGPTRDAPNNGLHYTWDDRKDGSLKKLEQDLRVGRGKAMSRVDAKYDGKRHRTEIKSDVGKSILPGLVLLHVAASSDALVIEF
jgi:hypothetical protein